MAGGLLAGASQSMFNPSAEKMIAKFKRWLENAIGVWC
jgi:hypothetical protein